MMWGQRGPRGQHGVETTETTEETMETTAMGTTWGPSGGYGDDMGTTGTTRGPQGHGDNMGWRPRRQQRRQRRPQLWGPHGDLLGAMGLTWG